jgi:hypothetical protein
MSHFDLSEWTDFVNAVLSDERRAALDRHLGEGCTDCATTLELLRKVAQASAADRASEVPPELVTAAEAIFGERYHTSPSQLLPRIVAHLIFYNSAELQPAGVRGAQAVIRQLAFEAGDYCLDLSLGGDAIKTSLVGQFINKIVPTAPQAYIPVLLISGEVVVCRTMTNEFGEFSLEYQTRQNMRLCLPIAAEGFQIEVSLKEVA